MKESINNQFMIKTIKTKLQEWVEDFVHKIKTGESTIRCSDGHKVYIDEFGASRVDTSEILTEILRLKKVREELESLSKIPLSKPSQGSS